MKAVLKKLFYNKGKKSLHSKANKEALFLIGEEMIWKIYYCISH